MIRFIINWIYFTVNSYHVVYSLTDTWSTDICLDWHSLKLTCKKGAAVRKHKDCVSACWTDFKWELSEIVCLQNCLFMSCPQHFLLNRWVFVFVSEILCILQNRRDTGETVIQKTQNDLIDTRVNHSCHKVGGGTSVHLFLLIIIGLIPPMWTRLSCWTGKFFFCMLEVGNRYEMDSTF